MAESRVWSTLIDVTCSLLELDARLTEKAVPYETRVLRLKRAREVLLSVTAGTLAAEEAERELQSLLHPELAVTSRRIDTPSGRDRGE